MTETGEIIVNGSRLPAGSGITLPDVLHNYGIDLETARGVAVAVNDVVVRRQDWANQILSPGDRIEVVTAKQGG